MASGGPSPDNLPLGADHVERELDRLAEHVCGVVEDVAREHQVVFHLDGSGPAGGPHGDAYREIEALASIPA